MIVGADVTHPGNEEGCPSIAAVVATDDDRRFQYLGSARIQEGKQEVRIVVNFMSFALLTYAPEVYFGPSGNDERKASRLGQTCSRR